MAQATIRLYNDLSEAEQNELAEAWALILKGLREYERITGAYDLDDLVYDDLWETIEYQKTEQGEEE